MKQNQVDKLHRASHKDHRSASPKVSSSFVKINKMTVRLHPGNAKKNGKIAGAGNEGRVKYCDDEGKTLTIKIDKPAPSSPRMFGGRYENDISKDVGLFLEVGYRRKRDRDCRYAIMPDLGKNLSDYIHQQKYSLALKKRLDIAIKSIYQVYRLHAGITAKSGKPIAHRDIKLDNFIYDEQKDKVTLVDYGFATYDDITQIPSDSFPGSVLFHPYIPFTKKNFDVTLEGIDTFGLKRCCYMPDSVIHPGSHKIINTKLIGGFGESLLNKEMIETLNLTPYFETASGHTHFHSALFLGYALALASINQSALIETHQHDTVIQEAIMVLYFTHMLDEKHLYTVISDPPYALKLASHIAEAETLSGDTVPLIPSWFCHL